MDELYISLFGPPAVMVEGQPVVFSYRKAAALFYYLVLNHQVPRREAASLLWGDSDSSSALKNLRHAIYTIRKNIGFDVFLPGSSNMLQLRDDLVIHCDVLDFMQKSILPPVQKEFMEGFDLQNCELFDNWMTELRRSLRAGYLEILLTSVKEAVQQKDMEKAERLGLRYIRMDPLEESVAVTLMQIYREEKKYRKAISIYHDLCKSLSAELSISPLKETSNLYYQIIDEWNSSTQLMEAQSNESILGKDGVLSDLLSLCNRPLTESRIPCFLVEGETGVGKTYLLDHLLSDYDFSDWLVCRCFCYQSESRIPLAPWNAIMMTLMAELEVREFNVPENFRKTAAALFPCLSASFDQDYVSSDLDYPLQQNYHVAQESALMIFATVARHFPTLLVFEDTHWMDKNSVELLGIFLRRLRNLNITVICTCRDVCPGYIRDFWDSAQRDGITLSRSLHCFDPEDTSAFIRQHLKRDLSPNLTAQIYERTGGNAMLLGQLLNVLRERPDLSQLSEDLGDIIDSRLADLTLEERQVLDLISIFPDWAPFQALAAILTKETIKLMYLCSRLKQRMLIKENCREDTLSYALAHELVRSNLMKQQSAISRRMLHARVAQYLENQLNSDSPPPYERLIYHYQHSGDKFKVFQYQVLSLDEYSGLHYTVLPTLEAGQDITTQQHDVFNYFYMLEKELTELRGSHKADGAQLDQLEITLLLAKSRCSIYVGQYDVGLDAAERLNDLSLRTQDARSRIRAQMQYLYYGIQTCNTKVMGEHLDILAELLSQHPNSQEHCIYLRISGLYQLLLGHFELSRSILQRSIDAFKALDSGDDRYAINIAGAYNYIAESYRQEGDYRKAFLAYDQAILYNRSRGYYPGSAGFYTNYGTAAYQAGEHQAARQLFIFALETYRAAHEYSGRPIALSYLAYYDAVDGNYSRAADYLQEAQRVTDLIASPQWNCVVHYRSWKIHQLLDQQHQEAAPLRQLWCRDLKKHAQQCLACLKEDQPCYITQEHQDAVNDLEQFLSAT